MRNLLALIGLAVVLFVGVGYVRGWYAFSFTTGSDGKTDVNVKLDTNKVKADAHEGADKVGTALDGFRTPAPAPTGTGAAAPAPPAGLSAPK